MALSSLNLKDWKETCNTLHIYAKLLGKIRAASMPKQKHWGHITLYVDVFGLNTGPIPVPKKWGQTFHVSLDFINHRVLIATNQGNSFDQTIVGVSPAAFYEGVLGVLHEWGLDLKIDKTPFSHQDRVPYEKEVVLRYFKMVSFMDSALKEFKGLLREETSPVHLFPHHFDLAMSWYSGDLIPGQDPADEEMSDKAITFGFSMGDNAIPNPYLYATSYPQSKDWKKMTLPEGFQWNKKGWEGVIIPYEKIAGSENPRAFLLQGLQQIQSNTAKLMK